MNHRIRVRWMKWKSASRILCEMPFKLKGKFYKIVMQLAMSIELNVGLLRSNILIK